VYHVLPSGEDHEFTVDNTHFIVSNPSALSDKLYASGLTIVQPTATEDGAVSATVVLETGMSTIKIQVASTDDLDGSNIGLVTKATGIVMHVENLEAIQV